MLSEACEIIKVVTIVPGSFGRLWWCNVCPPYMGRFFFQITTTLHSTAAAVRQHVTQCHYHIAQAVVVVDGCDN